MICYNMLSYIYATFYNMLSYAMLYNMLCSVMFILRYRTCNVSVMLYNMLLYVTLYKMLCCVMLVI